MSSRFFFNLCSCPFPLNNKIYFSLSDLSFPRAQILVPWTPAGQNWHYVRWPYMIHMTLKAAYLFMYNQYEFKRLRREDR